MTTCSTCYDSVDMASGRVKLVRSAKEPSDFSSVFRQYLNEDEKVEVMMEARATATQIEYATSWNHTGPAPEGPGTSYLFPRNTSHCSGPTGFCEYRAICSSRTPPEDLVPGAWKRNLPDHPELEGKRR